MSLYQGFGVKPPAGSRADPWLGIRRAKLPEAGSFPVLGVSPMLS